jgi:Endonuclease/Exonuclease/phosphatase family
MRPISSKHAAPLPGNTRKQVAQNQTTAPPSHRMRRWALAAIAILCLGAAGAQAGAAFQQDRDRFSPPGPRDLTVMQQNLYVGAEFTPILTLDPTDPYYGRDLLMAVAQVYQTIVASDFPKRAEALGRQIAMAQPELIGLQEVSLLRMQTPGDALFGGNTPATDVQLDYLAVLLRALHRRGLHYEAVAVVTNLDMEMPMPTTNPAVFTDVRLTDRDVILVRAGLPPGHLRVSHPQAGNFPTALPLPSLGLSIPRGWCSVDVQTRGRSFRFINAHLEENTAPLIQTAQALELLAGPAATALPVIMVGDFNSDANGNDGTTTYDLLTPTFTDAWNVAHPRDPGLTWGHDPFLADPSVEFIWRLDLVLFHGPHFRVVNLCRTSPQFQTTPPLWPSDHAGVVARFLLK